MGSCSQHIRVVPSYNGDRGYAYTATAATEYLNQGDEVVAVLRSIENSDADVLIRRGPDEHTVVETKNLDWSSQYVTVDKLKSDLGETLLTTERQFGKRTEFVVDLKNIDEAPTDEIRDYVIRKQDGGYNIRLATDE